LRKDGFKVDALKKYATKWQITTYKKNVIGFKKDGRWMSVADDTNKLRPIVIADRKHFLQWERFTVVKSDGKYALKSHYNNKYLQAGEDGLVRADQDEIGTNEKFEIGCWGKHSGWLSV
jgi:hypothetical protein